MFAALVQAQKPFQNGQAARAVVGQLNFTQGLDVPSQQVLGGASGIAWAGNQLYVADSNRVAATPEDHRVLVFDTTQIPGPYTDITQDSTVSNLVYCYVCGASASLSLGQDTFVPPTITASGTTTQAFYSGRNGTQDPTSGASPSEHAWFNNATAVATDGVRLAVADTDNNRVLLWTSLPTAMNQNPNLVVGQPDFATVQAQQLGVVNATSMRGPQGVWIQNNRLYVADTQNYRVLIWNSFPTTNNQPPDVVLGQPDFNHANGPAPSKIGPPAAANQLLNPVSVTADASHVFVADLGFNRVLIWNTPSPGMDQNADVVVGQADFVGSTANNTTVCPTVTTGSGVTNGPCAFGLNYPRFALSDGKRLFIADGGNDRVLIYNSIPTSNNPAPNNVLGQTTFNTDIVTSAAISIVSTQIDNTGGVDTTPTPTSLAWDGTNLYVADPYNRRVLLFTAGDSLLPSASDPTATVIPVVNWASEIVRQEGTISLTLAAGGTITANDTATVTIQSVAYTYTEKSSDTLDTIAKALTRLINATDTNVTATFAGAGTGGIYLSSLQANLGFDTITLAASTSNTNNVVATASGAYLSAGNAATVAAGTLIEVNAPPGVTFTDNNTTVTAPLGGLLPNELSGVQLYMDGYASHLFKVSQTQIVGQIPYFYGDRNSTSVYVRTVHNDGSVTVTNATPVYIAPANPGIFNAPQYAGQPRPWPASMAYHQLGNPTAVVSVDGSVTAGNTATITVGTASYTYTVTASDTLATIVTGLINLIAADPNVTPTAGGAFTRVVLTAKLNGFSGGNGIPVATSTSSGASVTLTAYTSSTCCAVQSGSLIYLGNPAVPGELISISTAGLGPIVDANGNGITLETGVPYSGTSQNDVYSPNFVAATMGGETAQVIYSGLPDGSYGIYRVDLIVPSGLAANADTPLYIAQNAFISNTVSLPVGAAVANPGPPPLTGSSGPIVMSIDSPSTGSTISGVIDVGGWAIDTSVAVQSVSVLVDGVLNGSAAYGGPRPDACASHPTGVHCPYVAFDYALDTSTIGNGVHTFQVTVTDVNGGRLTTANSDVTVNNNAAQYHTHVNVETPWGGGVYHGVVEFGGWALNDTSRIVGFKGAIDGVPINGSAVTYNIPRPDVCAANVYPGRPGCPNVGWSYLADLSGLAIGTHTFSFTAIAADGEQYTFFNSFLVNNFSGASSSGPSISIDTPSANAGTVSGTTGVAGWAIDPISAVGSVAISVDGVSFGNALYGGVRNDVCTVFSNPPGCPNVGWNASLDTTQLADGTHTLEVTSYPFASQPYTVTRTITVGNLGSAANPIFIGIDRPSAGSANLTGMAAIGGWALSNTAPIQTVTVSVDGVMNGTASYGGARPDVCAVFSGRPGCPNVGWNYVLDTTRLAPGSHMLEVTGTDASGKRASGGAAFTVSNSSAAGQTAVETPGPSNHPYNGIARFSGWALNSSASIISVMATVDGVPVGNASYGAARPDVCATFSSPDCPNVGWSYSLNTTVLSDGTHTFGVIATAADGTTSSASASFVIANWTAVMPMTIQIDTPNGNLSNRYSGIVNFGGWLVDSLAHIQSVSISVDDVPFGNASIGGYRPDACVSNASPDCPNVGWNFVIDTTFLSNDIHTLGVTGTNTAGQSYTVTQSFSTAN